jgi:hypothetical protein
VKISFGSLKSNVTPISTGLLAVLSTLSGLGFIHIDPAKVQAGVTILGALAAFGIHTTLTAQNAVAAPQAPPAAPPQP